MFRLLLLSTAAGGVASGTDFVKSNTALTFYRGLALRRPTIKQKPSRYVES